MRVDSQSSSCVGDITFPTYQYCFHGVALDARGSAALKHANAISNNSVSLKYYPDDLSVDVAGNKISVDEFATHIRKMLIGPILLESSTLGFVEILLCCRSLADRAVNCIDLLYVEPGRYKSHKINNLLHCRDFELSSEVPGFQAIPGNAILLGDRRPQKGIFFLGYEESRLRRAFEDLQMLQPDRSAIAFGVPAFKPGWEMDAMANNIDVISEHRIGGGVHYCGANNPVAVIGILEEIQCSLAPDEKLYIAPIGTKPHGIGVALFVSVNRNIGIIYDHPIRTQGRSSEISDWHLYSVTNFKESL